MLARRRRRRYSSEKPQFGAAVVDWGHPLAKGLSCIFLINERAGLPIELVGNNRAEGYNGTWEGDKLDLNGSTHRARFNHTPNQSNPTTEVTIITRFKYNGTSDNWGGIIDKSRPAGNPYREYGILSDGNGLNIGCYINVNGTERSIDSGYTPPTTSYVIAVGRWKSGEAVKINMYNDSLQQLASASSSNYSGSITKYNDYFHIGSAEDGTSCYGMLFDYGFVWDWQMTVNQVKRIIANPYQMLVHGRRF